MKNASLFLCMLFSILFSISVCAESGNLFMTDEFLSFFNGPRKIADYRYTNVPFKPYIKRFFTPSGLQVLEDAPHDHLHHHGLMFAIAVNDTNYWEESEKSGHQIHQKFSNINIGEKLPISMSSFVEELAWKSPEKDIPQLTEIRKISSGYWEQENANVILWETQLENPSETEIAKLTGHHYFGLGIRLLTTPLEKVDIITPIEDNLENVRGDEYLRNSPWCAIVVKNEIGTFTLLMVDMPDSVRYPARWFSMRMPFVYISATRNLWKEPLEISPRDKVLCKNILVLWDGEKTKEALEKAVEEINNLCKQK
ncbi:MAG TPA: PmoA family protein [Candidatus Hydrogenedens sp.]|nr:PmoA family protein [Candidatus Hydrogenedens sp.]